jgi:hypothetical protein
MFFIFLRPYLKKPIETVAYSTLSGRTGDEKDYLFDRPHFCVNPNSVS